MRAAPSATAWRPSESYGSSAARSTGAARGASADDGLSSLTERELELARLVVDRKTNPQIAAELFLSQKTVETHLRNMFRKVGVANASSSRALSSRPTEPLGVRLQPDPGVGS